MSTFCSDDQLPRVIAPGCTNDPLELDVAHDMLRPVVRLSLDSQVLHVCAELSPTEARDVAAALVRQAEEAERS